MPTCVTRRVTIRTVAPLSLAILADREGYFQSLRGYDAGDVDGFVARFARGGVMAAAASERLAIGLSELVEEWDALPEVARSRRDADL